jgi:tetratricopeptide (TPR) repeat protein
MLDELLLEKLDPRLLVSVLIQQSVVWRSLGSQVAASAFLDSAALHARPDSPRENGWVQHQRAQLLIEQRQFAAAAKCLALAVKYHRQAKAPHDEALALLSMAKLKFDQGQPRAATVAARRAERFATRHKTNRVRLSALLEQARAHLALGSIDAGKKLLHNVLADSMVANDNTLCFYAHFYLWQAEQSAGHVGRAAVELREISHYVKFVDQNSPESRIARRELGSAPRDSDGGDRGLDLLPIAGWVVGRPRFRRWSLSKRP